MKNWIFLLETKAADLRTLLQQNSLEANIRSLYELQKPL